MESEQRIAEHPSGDKDNSNGNSTSILSLGDVDERPYNKNDPKQIQKIPFLSKSDLGNCQKTVAALMILSDPKEASHSDRQSADPW